MVKNLLLPCACALALAVTARAWSQADTPAKQLPFAGSPPPEELQVLAPLVGVWNLKSEVRPSLQNKEGYTASGETTVRWLHNRHFLCLETTILGPKQREEATVLYSFDARKKVYRRWLFSSTGLTSESEGQWDRDRQTMTWKPLNLPPNTTGSIVDVLAGDRRETTIFLKRDDGQVLVDIKATSTPKKRADK